LVSMILKTFSDNLFSVGKPYSYLIEGPMVF